MPIPAGVEQVTVTDGSVPLTGPDGTVLEGSFTVAGPDLATVKEDDYLFGGSARRWVTAGRFDPLTLVATDATGVDPTGFSYSIVFTPKYGKPWTRYFQLPKASPSVVLADILVSDPVAGTYTVLADASTLLAKAANLSDVADPATARDSLGLGDAAVADIGTAAGTVAAGNDARMTNARTPLAHAPSHAAGGGDPVSPASIGAYPAENGNTLNGYVTDLQNRVGGEFGLENRTTAVETTVTGKASKAGDTFTGDVVMDGANLVVQREDGTGAFRLRVTGGGLDFEIGGMDVTVSVWSEPDYTGTQSNVARWEPAGPHLIGRTQFGTGPFDNVHDIDAGTGVAALGKKNGLANIRLAGFKDSAGAPTTGAWAAGDVVLDSAGAWHLCTAPGTPGTWT